MTGADIIAAIILTALAIAIFVYLLHWLYRRSSKEVSFVRTGLRGEKVILSGGAFVLPIIHNITSVGMRTLRIEVKRGGDKSFITKNRMRVEIIAEFYVRVTPSKEAVSIAAGTLGKRTMEPESLRELVQGRFVDALGIVAAQMTMEEIQEKRGEYIKEVKVIVAESLSATGLELEAVSLTSLDQAGLEVFNPSNAFDAEGLTQLTEQIEAGKKKRNDIEQDTTIRIRAKNLEAEQKALEIDQQREFSRLSQEREIAKQRDRERTDMAIETSTQDTIEVERSLREHELTLQIEERKRLRNEIERQTETDIKQKNLEAEIRALDIQKENEFARLQQEEDIASQRAKQKTEVLKVESEQYIESEQAQIKANEEVKKMEIDQKRSLEISRINNDQLSQASEIQKRKNLEIEEKDRELEIIAKTVEVLKAVENKEHIRAQVVVAEEQVQSAQEVEVAERQKKLQIINAEKEGESEAIQITTLARAEKEAAQEQEQTDKYASLASKLRYEVDAAGNLMLNEAENARSDESRQSDLRMEIAKNLDSIIREAVKPRENIDDIKIYELNGMPGFNSNSSNGDFVGPVNGGGNFSENVVNSALRYRAQAPFVDNLLDEIGMSSKEISNIKNILGDYKKDEKKGDDIEGDKA